MNFPYYIAKRYLFAKSGNNAINLITIIATLGVVVGAAALFIILSGFSGLRNFSYSLLDVSDPDIKISVADGKSFFYTDSLETILTAQEGVVSFSKVIEERVFLRNGDKELIAYVKGVDTNYSNIVKIDSAIIMGTWLNPEFLNTAVIGNGISYRLSLGVMNYNEGLQINVPKAGTGFLGANSFRTENVKVAGIYAGSEEFENKYVYVSNKVAQHLMRYKDHQFSAIEIDLNDEVNPDEIALELQEKLGSTYRVQTKAQLNELFYKVINTENFVSYLIFTLIVMIALFNVIGAIIMMIIDKKKNLQTLLNLGATLKEVKRIFVLQGFLLSLVGMSVGLFIASVLILLQQQFELFMITANIAYPVEFKLSNLFIVILTITTLGFLAAKIASSRISANFIGK